MTDIMLASKAQNLYLAAPSCRILRHRKVIDCNYRQWLDFMLQGYRGKVRSTWLGNIHVSTVFLSHENGPLPKWFRRRAFETMIFGIDDDSYQTHCDTWREALAMHWAAVDHARK